MKMGYVPSRFYNIINKKTVNDAMLDFIKHIINHHFLVSLDNTNFNLCNELHMFL